MEVYHDIVLGGEFFSNAKRFEEVKDAEGNVVEGIIAVPTIMTCEDGDPDDDDSEKKLDHFWAFPEIGEEPIKFKKFKEFRDEYFKKYMKGLLKIKQERGDFKEDDDQKEFQQRMTNIMGWIKANFGDMDLYQCTDPTAEYTDKKGKTKDYYGSMIYALYIGAATTPVFCFLKDGYYIERC